MSKPQLFYLVGGNGSGKSTFYDAYLKSKSLPFVNADILAKELYQDSAELHSYDAAVLAQKQRASLLEKKQSFCFETVFSHPSKLDFLAEAITQGYEVILIEIFLDTPELNAARVNFRINSGGHSVPEEKIHSRIPRMKALFKKAIPLATESWLIDNSSYSQPFKQILRFKHGAIVFSAPQLPDWANYFMGTE